ncbi:MAG: putative membrane protein [Glaciecola sp.]|jgi:uncharacterized membrane protein
MDCLVKIAVIQPDITNASVHSLRSLGQLYGRISLRSKAAPIKFPVMWGVIQHKEDTVQMIETQQNKPLAYLLICLSIALTCFAVYFVLYSELLIMPPTLLGIASLLFLLGRQKMKKWRMDNLKFNSYVQTATQGVLLFALALTLFKAQG